MTGASKEGLSFARFLMVLSGASPLFILWAIKGIDAVPDRVLWATCAIAIIVPNLFLVWRIYTAKKLKEVEAKVIGQAEDHRDHLLVYLFAMLLPFYSVDLHQDRALLATVAALVFVIFLFWHLNLHYMNIMFALRGYRIFTVSPLQKANALSNKDSFVVITRRTSLHPSEKLILLRISQTVFFEEEQ